MFWSFVLPFMITACVMGSLILVVFILAVILRRIRKRSIIWCLLLCPLLFIPSCYLIKGVVDTMRFGNFTYPDATAVGNRRVARWLPPSAKEVKVYCWESSNGHVARFRIDKAVLVKWLDDFRAMKQRESDPDASAGVVANNPSLRREEFDEKFGKLGGDYPPDNTALQGWCDMGGKGFLIWYSEKQGMAYMDAGYW